MSKQFHQTFPSATRPLLVWQWRGSLQCDHVEESLKRFSKLGFGGIILAPRGENALLNFPSKAWLEVAAMVSEHAQRLRMEFWIEIPLADPFGAGVFKDTPPDMFICPGASDPSPGNGTDLLSAGASSRFIDTFLEPCAPFLNKGKGAPRGIVLGNPEWPAGCEPWNEEIAAALREQGFSQPSDCFEELFSQASGDLDRSFAYALRREAAHRIRDGFAAPLRAWTAEKGLQFLGPPEQRDDAFPAWVFGAAGAARRIDTVAGQSAGESLSHAFCRPRGDSAISVSLPWDSPDAIGMESIRRTIEPFLVDCGARAILNWAPWDGRGLELDDAYAPLPCMAPGLAGLESLNLRLTSWTAIGRSSSANSQILSVYPRTSLWRLPNMDSAVAADTGDNEGIRQKNLWTKLGAALSNAGFRCDCWDERRQGAHPAGHSGKLDFGDSEYRFAILPGALNLTKETWVCLADFAASGGQVLTIERFPAFLDGVASSELSDWARRYVERFKTTGSFIAWLEQRVKRPVKMSAVAPGGDVPAPETALRDSEEGKQWIVVRNPKGLAAARGVVEIDAGLGEALEEVCLETGAVSTPCSISRTESAARIRMEFAPGEARLLRRSKNQRAKAEQRTIAYEEHLTADWRVRSIGDNLLPLAAFEYCLHGMPWTGPEPLVELHQALKRQAPQWSGGPQSDICLRTRFFLGGMPLIGGAELLQLGLLVSPKAPIRSILLNGRAGEAPAGVSEQFPGLTRMPLPLFPQEGENILEIRFEYAEAQELQSIVSGPWILTGRFGVDQGVGVPCLRATMGDREWLSFFVNEQMSLVGGIRELEKKQRMKPFDLQSGAWADWPHWPLLHGHKSMPEVGFPFYGGMVELEREFFVPDSKSARTRWKSATAQMGPSLAAWVEIEINDSPAGGVGLSPFRCEIGHLLKAGERNKMAVRAWMPWLNALTPFHRCARGLPGRAEVIPCGFRQSPKILYFQ